MATVISSIDGCECRTSSKVTYLKSVPAETYIKSRGFCEKSYGDPLMPGDVRVSFSGVPGSTTFYIDDF